jgi:hypothetical protein
MRPYPQSEGEVLEELLERGYSMKNAKAFAPIVWRLVRNGGQLAQLIGRNRPALAEELGMLRRH